MKITIKAARVNAGLHQSDVTAKTGIARSTLTRWETGQTTPSETKLSTLCELYGVQIWDIDLGRARNPRPLED